MKTLTLTNDYHGTEARVRPIVAIRPTKIGLETGRETRSYLGLTHRQVLRARRKLCGIADCECGGPAGERGGRYWVQLWHEDEYSAARNVYTLHDSHLHGRRLAR